jgi:hypothetical protein
MIISSKRELQFLLKTETLAFNLEKPEVSIKYEYLEQICQFADRNCSVPVKLTGFAYNIFVTTYFWGSGKEKTAYPFLS